MRAAIREERRLARVDAVASRVLMRCARLETSLLDAAPFSARVRAWNGARDDDPPRRRSLTRPDEQAAHRAGVGGVARRRAGGEERAVGAAADRFGRLTTRPSRRAAQRRGHRAARRRFCRRRAAPQSARRGRLGGGRHAARRAAASARAVDALGRGAEKPNASQREKAVQYAATGADAAASLIGAQQRRRPAHDRPGLRQPPINAVLRVPAIIEWSATA